MSTIHGTIQFGVKVQIKTPLSVNKEAAETFVGRAEQALTKAILGAVSTTLQILPGFEISVGEGVSKIQIVRVDP